MPETYSAESDRLQPTIPAEKNRPGAIQFRPMMS